MTDEEWDRDREVKSVFDTLLAFEMEGLVTADERPNEISSICSVTRRILHLSKL